MRQYIYIAIAMCSIGSAFGISSMEVIKEIVTSPRRDMPFLTEQLTNLPAEKAINLLINLYKSKTITPIVALQTVLSLFYDKDAPFARHRDLQAVADLREGLKVGEPGSTYNEGHKLQENYYVCKRAPQKGHPNSPCTSEDLRNSSDDFY